MKFGLACAVLILASVACSPGGGGSATGYRVETVATGLEVPWAIAFLPNGDMLITERPGRVRLYTNGQLQAQPVFTLADTQVSSEGGLMGICLHPNFATDHYVYLAYSSATDAGYDRIVRYSYLNSQLTGETLILSGIPAAQFHAGCRIKFGPDGKLYITTGEATEKNLAQDLGSLGGKILRVNDDGSVPSDNPFVGQQGARGEIWCYGNRNPQGIAWQPNTNTLWEAEHGPSGGDAPDGGDEVNIIEKGKNYGWPTIHHTQTAAGMESPLLEYTPAIAPSAAMFYIGTRLPQFDGNFFFTRLKGQGLQRVTVSGSNVIDQETILSDYGRVREVIQGPDGAIYFTTSNRDGRGSPTADDDRILRIVPIK